MVLFYFVWAMIRKYSGMASLPFRYIGLRLLPEEGYAKIFNFFIKELFVNFKFR